MTRAILVVSISVALIPAMAMGQRTEIERFEGGFGNDFFSHQFDFPSCCLEFSPRIETGSVMLRLFPNSDVINFDLGDAEFVRSVRVEILDFEGGFVGDRPTSVLYALGSSGDFVVRSAQQIGVVETLEITSQTPGQLTGASLGNIVSIRLDAANEGNSVIPNEVGAYFDNLTAETREFGAACPGDVNGDLDVDLTDLATLLANFGTAGGATYDVGDLDFDGDVDLTDLATMLAEFGSNCE